MPSSSEREQQQLSADLTFKQFVEKNKPAKTDEQLKEEQASIERIERLRALLGNNRKPQLDPTRPEDYQRLAERTEVSKDLVLARLSGQTVPRKITQLRCTHALIGLMGEVGELSGALEKAVFYGTKDFDKTNIAEEIGDCLWYLAMLCNAFGLDMSAVMQMNISKLKVRYPEKFSEEKCANRDLEAERKVLEETECTTLSTDHLIEFPTTDCGGQISEPD